MRNRIKHWLGNIFFILVVVASFFLAAIFNTAMVWAIWYGMVFIFILCVSQMVWPLGSIHWQVAPRQAVANQPFQLTAQVRMKHWWQWLTQVQVRDQQGWQSPLLLLGKRPVPDQWHAQLPRGVFSHLTVDTAASDLFGLLRRGRRLRVPVDIMVVPAAEPALAAKVLPALNALRARQQSGLADPYSLKGFRPYVPGDPLGVIDWQITARTGHPMIRELLPEPTPFIHILFSQDRPHFDEQTWALFYTLQQATANWTNVQYWWPDDQGVWQTAHRLAPAVAAAYQPAEKLAAWAGAGTGQMQGATVVTLGSRRPELPAGVHPVQIQIGTDGTLVWPDRRKQVSAV
ncbi:MAG: DUF58 domain-containing protein [Schleiferilactobacillus perolens]|uniref:DUF58 domain-containing protein n=1 Tax=Schleiferilactobacillus perolens TaxID=100468 RepID=UPI0039E9D9B4